MTDKNKRECTCSSCNGECNTNNVINFKDYKPKTRDKANIITYADILVSEKIEDKGVDTGTNFKHTDNIPFIISYEGLSFTVNSFTVYDNINEIRFYNKDNKSITTLNIENKTAMVTEVKSDNNDDATKLILEIDDFVYLDHDENKFPRIRSEFYPSINEGEDLFIVDIYLKPSSLAKELLVYKLELPNKTREQAIFIAQNYIYNLEVIKHILNGISISENSYIASPDSITRIEGFSYGGLLIDTNEVIPYHYLTNLPNSTIIFDRTIYASHTDFVVKTNNGKYENLTDDETELVLNTLTKFNKFKDSEEGEYTLEEVTKEYEEISKKLNNLFPDSNNEEDILIILNDEGNFTPLSLFQYGKILTELFKDKE